MAPKIEKKEGEKLLGATLLSSKANVKDLEKGVPLHQVVVTHSTISTLDGKGQYAPVKGSKTPKGSAEQCRPYLMCLLWLAFAILCGLVALIATRELYRPIRHVDRLPDFDCDADFPNWETGWSSAKKQYCCSRKGRGCQNPDGPRYQCHMGEVDRWPLTKQSWCCENYHIGCLKHDCTAGQDNWITSWSSEKKQLCCQRFDLGCPYECGADLSRAESAWSYDKKAWCCKERHMGCGGQVSKSTATESGKVSASTMGRHHSTNTTI
eukprot:TRINITY_DN3588_c0_g1_i4.p1 TRINITY_DN3588_c0_g1~~TRINITY_DN3588_c0_g1_i4.p1  ORF type:complete len:266 (-),score=48.26 TRINITY_DN3588_c0_g1_i4:81-878(-)